MPVSTLATNTTVDVSVLIYSKGESKSSFSLILSLLNQQRPTSSFEILVITPFSRLSLEKQIRELDAYTDVRIRLFASFKPDLTPGVNKAIEAARGEILLFLDDQCLVEDGMLLEEHLRAHRDRPDEYIVCGSYELREKAGVLSSAAYLWDYFESEKFRVGIDRLCRMSRGHVSVKKTLFFSGFRFSGLGPIEPLESLNRHSSKSFLSFCPQLVVTDARNPSLYSFLEDVYQRGRLKRGESKVTFVSFHSQSCYHAWYHFSGEKGLKQWLIYSVLQLADIVDHQGRTLSSRPSFGQSFVAFLIWWRANHRELRQGWFFRQLHSSLRSLVWLNSN